jgi:hypothetical protein
VNRRSRAEALFRTIVPSWAVVLLAEPVADAVSETSSAIGLCPFHDDHHPSLELWYEYSSL